MSWKSAFLSAADRFFAVQIRLNAFHKLRAVQDSFFCSLRIYRDLHTSVSLEAAKENWHKNHPGEKGGRGDGLSHFGGLSLQD